MPSSTHGSAGTPTARANTPRAEVPSELTYRVPMNEDDAHRDEQRDATEDFLPTSHARTPPAATPGAADSRFRRPLSNTSSSRFQSAPPAAIRSSCSSSRAVNR